MIVWLLGYFGAGQTGYNQLQHGGVEERYVEKFLR